MRNKVISINADAEMREIMETIYAQIDELIIDLLVPARTKKTIDQETFQRFWLLLEEIEKKVRDEEYISKKIVGILFFIYTQLSTEASYCDYTDELFIAVGRLEGMLDNIFDSP